VQHVLVTGAGGLVGTAVVDRLLADGWKVTATDLPTAANRKTLARFRSVRRFAARWADLTEEAEVAGLLNDLRPDVVVHLAAVIPPTCYAVPEAARAVNVDAVGILTTAARALARRPRGVLASSIAVYGARNPHRELGLLTSETPLAPTDSYGQHKTEAEAIVRGSGLDFVILRLGGVLTVESRAGSKDALRFGAMLPADGRIQTVDVRDVAAAFEAAAQTPTLGATFLIGGDESHRLVQREIGRGVAAAMGLDDALPAGRPGDPDDDRAWFATDWMETAPAQEALGFQHHSWDGMLEEIRRRTGWRRYLLRLAAPVVREVLGRRSARASGTYADVWGEVREQFGDPSPDAVA
jgi:nucleoside-diphosphate-sugar epimerase